MLLLKGSFFIVEIYGWYAQEKAKKLRADGLRRGAPIEKVDEVIVDAFLMLGMEGKGVRIVSVIQETPVPEL